MLFEKFIMFVLFLNRCLSKVEWFLPPLPTLPPPIIKHIILYTFLDNDICSYAFEKNVPIFYMQSISI